MTEDNYCKMIKELNFISPQELPPGNYTIFGTGDWSKQLIKMLDGINKVKITHVMEHDKVIEEKSIKTYCGKPVIKLGKEAENVILGTANLEFQYNQLVSLSKDKTKYKNIYYVDPENYLRNHEVSSPKGTVYVFESRTLNTKIKTSKINLRNLSIYFNEKKYNLKIASPLNFESFKKISTNDHILLWNGQTEPFFPVHNHLKKINKKPTFIEIGLFPQDSFFYFDKKGVNQESSLMDDDLDWVGPAHFEKLEKVKKDFLGSFDHKSKDYILVPLQIATDSNVINSSRFQNGMQEFIDFVCDFYDNNEKVVFKAHPKDPHKNSYDYRGHESSDLPFIKLLEQTKLVHGITSTTLYEAALAGVDVISEGVSLLNRHQSQPQKLLAAMIDRQIPISETNLDYWVKRYSNLKL